MPLGGDVNLIDNMTFSNEGPQLLICILNLVQSTNTDHWASIYEAINSDHRISHEKANSMLESFRESPKA